jgi:Flp pilus assembly protein TadG
MRSLAAPQIKRGFASDDRGASAIVFALMAVPVIATIGLALDFARANNQHEVMQSALDSAVLAAANAPVADKIAVGQTFFSANFPNGVAPATPAFTIDSSGVMTGTVSSTVSMPFASLAHLSSAQVDVDASATPDSTITTTAAGNAPCIHVLDQSGAKTFSMDSNSSLNASNCVVQVRSNNTKAMNEVSSSNVKFKKILVKGGATYGSGLTIMDAPNHVLEQAIVVGDPFNTAITAVTKGITPAPCTAANTNKTLTGAVKPGTYCGATVFSAAKFAAGLYIIASDTGCHGNGTLTIQGATNGSAGVSFYFADNGATLLSYKASEGSTLQAPASGPTRGLLFFENSNRGLAYPFTLGSVNKQSWTGLVYMPSMNLTMNSLSSWTAMNISLAVNQLKMISLSSVMMPYSWTPYNQTQAISLGDGTQTTTTTQGYMNN